MSARGASPSPSRRGSVKVTYAGRHRRLLSNGLEEDGGSVSSGGVESGSEMDRGREVTKAARSESETKVPKVHKRVDSLDLPGPAPRHKRSNSKDSTSSRRQSNTHKRLSSVDMTASPKTPIGARSPMELPLSVISSKVAMSQKMKMRMETPEVDAAAALPSPISPHTPDPGKQQKHTNEAERLAYFKNHPDVGEVEPHRVFCNLCTKWLKLHSTQRYALAAWKTHKMLCSPGKPVRKGRPKLGTDPDSPSRGANNSVDDDAASVAPSDVSLSIAASTATAKRSVEERKRILENDDLTTEVREDEVFCGPCNKWIRLAPKTKYSLSNWQIHTKGKHGRVVEGPSLRVQEAERKLQLVNDAQAKEFTANSVVCGNCDASVRLSDKVPYDVMSWLAHKAVCSSRKPPMDEPMRDVTDSTVAPPSSPKGDDASLIQSPVSRPPPSAASSDTTFVNPSAAASSPPKSVAGTKRPREEDPTDGTIEESPSVKPRTESYVPSDAQPPGPWGWFWLPWEAFKRGFVEGFVSSSSSSSSTTPTPS